MRLGLFANNCIAPGFSSLIHLLSTSINDRTFKVIRQFVQQNQKSLWILDYMEGATQEFYETKFSSSFTGMTFLEAADVIYRHLKVVLFAIGIKKTVSALDSNGNEMKTDPLGWLGDDESDYDLYLNPGKYVIRGNEIAFLIASDRKTACRVEQLSGFENDDSLVADSLNDYFDPTLKKDSGGDQETDPLLETFGFSSNDEIKIHVESSEDEASSSRKRKGKTVRGVSAAGRKQHSRGRTVTNILPGTYELFHQVKEDITFFREAFFQDKRKKDSPLKRLPDHVTDHVLICDTGSRFPLNLDCFIEPLRGGQLGVKTPIAILCPTQPSPEEEEYLSKFEEVCLYI